jgi:hypothetical protein
MEPLDPDGGRTLNSKCAGSLSRYIENANTITRLIRMFELLF